MRKTMLMIVMVGVALAACEKKNEPYQFKDSEVIIIQGVDQPKFKSTGRQYTVKEMLKDSSLQMAKKYPAAMKETGVISDNMMHIVDNEKDTINGRIQLSAWLILGSDGILNRALLDMCECYFVVAETTKENPYGVYDFDSPKLDTVGYIPQSVIDNAREQIEALYAQERFDEIYELFHSAFTFYTCTGEEYKQIVANGGN